jgi:hypothetical protein
MTNYKDPRIIHWENGELQRTKDKTLIQW